MLGLRHAMLIVVAREGVLQTRYLNEEIERRKALCLDLEWLRAGVLSSIENLEDAPLLDNYAITLRDVPALKGRVVAHPVIGTTTARTSAVFVMVPDLGWARTMSRFYRLGSPCDATARMFS